MEDLGEDMRAAEPRHMGMVDRIAEDKLVEDNSAVGKSVEDMFVADTSDPPSS